MSGTGRTGHPVAQHDQEVSRFFSGFSRSWDGVYGERRSLVWRVVDSTLRRDIAERYELTFDALGPSLRGQTILDVGCGSGVYAVEAAYRGAASVVGLDGAPGMIALARRRAERAGVSDVCRFVCARFPADTPLLELTERADSAIVMGVLDYVAAPVPFLRALKDAVRERAVISFPFRDRVRYPIRRWRYRMLGRCKVAHYSEAEVRQLCGAAGFARIDIRFLDHSGGCFFTSVFAGP
jgi:2-polyprenyl-3-methyl-5-hydroxy-6-metoxy-1,4-benzoquinol methylase